MCVPRPHACSWNAKVLWLIDIYTSSHYRSACTYLDRGAAYIDKMFCEACKNVHESPGAGLKKFGWIEICMVFFFTIKKNRIQSRPSGSNLGAQMTAAASCATWLIAESSQGSLFRQLPAAVLWTSWQCPLPGAIKRKGNLEAVGAQVKCHWRQNGISSRNPNARDDLSAIFNILATKLHCSPWTWPAFDWVANKYEADQMIAETCASCIQFSNLWCST